MPARVRCRSGMVLMPRSASVTSFRLNVKPNFAVCFPLVQLTSSLNWYWVTFLPSGHSGAVKIESYRRIRRQN